MVLRQQLVYAKMVDDHIDTIKRQSNPDGKKSKKELQTYSVDIFDKGGQDGKSPSNAE